MISTHLDHCDLRALVVLSRSTWRSLLPEYLRRRGLVLDDNGPEGLKVQLCDLGGYRSLGFWSAVRDFRPPKQMYCSIPCDIQEARSAMGCLIHFLLDPSNTRNLRGFHLSLHGSNPLLLTSYFIKLQRILHALPITELFISGYSSVDYLPPSIALRRGSRFPPPVLTSLDITSDLAFTPGLVRITMGILKHSPIKTLAIFMVSLRPPQWSTLLGELNMMSLEDVELEGDIPQSSFMRFLAKHERLKTICIKCDVPSDCIQPSRSRRQCQPFLPHLRSLDAPLAICCDIAERLGNSPRLDELKVEMGKHHPQDPIFRRLLGTVMHFRKLDHLGVRLLPNFSSAMPQSSLDGHDWDGYPARELNQIRVLKFYSDGQLSPNDIVRPHYLSSFLQLPYLGDRTQCVHMWDLSRWWTW